MLASAALPRTLLSLALVARRGPPAALALAVAPARARRPLCVAPVAPLADLDDVSVGRPVISWYPGHVAKAERLMSEVLTMVDVVVELRDSRIPHSTAHPMLSQWVGSRRHVRVLNRVDSVPERALSEWMEALRAEEDGPSVFSSDAKHGDGVQALKRAIAYEGRHVNDRRRRWEARGREPPSSMVLDPPPGVLWRHAISAHPSTSSVSRPRVLKK